MKTKAKPTKPKPAKLTDLKPRKDPNGGAQRQQTSSLRPKGGYGNHNETFLSG
jgi:hypothetical protein